MVGHTHSGCSSVEHPSTSKHDGHTLLQLRRLVLQRLVYFKAYGSLAGRTQTGQGRREQQL